MCCPSDVCLPQQYEKYDEVSSQAPLPDLPHLHAVLSHSFYQACPVLLGPNAFNKTCTARSPVLQHDTMRACDTPRAIMSAHAASACLGFQSATTQLSRAFVLTHPACTAAWSIVQYKKYDKYDEKYGYDKKYDDKYEVRVAVKS